MRHLCVHAPTQRHAHRCTHSHRHVHTHTHTHFCSRTCFCSSTFLSPRTEFKHVGASLISMGFTCVHLETAFSWWGRNDLSFSVATERKLDTRASPTIGSSFVGNSPNPLFQQVNRVVVLWAQGQGEGWCMGEELSIRGRKRNCRS